LQKLHAFEACAFQVVLFNHLKRSFHSSNVVEMKHLGCTMRLTGHTLQHCCYAMKACNSELEGTPDF